MRGKTISVYDVLVNFTSLLTFMLDCGTDILVTVALFEKGHFAWGSLTAGFIIGPLVLIQIFSLKWHYTDGSLSCCTVIPHLILLAPVQRYLRVIRLALRARQNNPQKFEDVDRVYREQNDVCILRLIETFVESAPQLILQLYIILLYRDISWLTGLSIAGSLVSMAWALTAYTDGLRLAYRDLYRRNLFSLIVHFLWETLMTGARVFAFVIFATVFKAWVFVAAGVHWVAMTLWIAAKGTDFGDGPCEKHLFQMVSGLIYIFCFLNLREGQTRYRMLTYYVVMLVENIILVVLWFLYKSMDTPQLDIAVPAVVFGGYLLGLICLLTYYRFLHPSGPISLSEKPAVLGAVLNNQTEPKVLNTSAFDFSNMSHFSATGSLTNVIELSTDFKTPPRPSSQRSSLIMYSKEALEEAWEAGLSKRHSSGSSESSLELTDTGNKPRKSDGKRGISKSYGNLINSTNMEKLLKFSHSYSDFYCDQPDRVDEKLRCHGESLSRGYRSTPRDAVPGRVVQQNYQRGSSGRQKVIMSPDGRIGFECTPERRRSSPNPVSLSPLDAAKLWAESQLRTESHFVVDHQDVPQFSRVETRVVSVKVDSFSPMLQSYDASSLYRQSSSHVLLQSRSRCRGSVGSAETEDINCSRFNASQSPRNENRDKPNKSPIPDLLHLTSGRPVMYDDQQSSADVSKQESRGSSFSLTDFLEKSYSKSLQNRSNGDYEEIWDNPSQMEEHSEHQPIHSNNKNLTNPSYFVDGNSYTDQPRHTNGDTTFQSVQSPMLTSQSRSSSRLEHTGPYLHQVTIHSSPLMSVEQSSSCSRTDRSPASTSCHSMHQSPLMSPEQSSNCIRTDRSPASTSCHSMHQSPLQMPLPLRRSLTAGSLDVSRSSRPSSRMSYTAARLLDPSERVPDTPWRLDYLNLEPQQAVLHNTNKEYANSIRQYLSSASIERTAMRREPTPLKLKDLVDSPVKFGRSVDLFHASDKQDMFAGKTSAHFRSGTTCLKENQTTDLDLPRLCNSPYRFRRHEYDESIETELSTQNHHSLVGSDGLHTGHADSSSKHYHPRGKSSHEDSFQESESRHTFHNSFSGSRHISKSLPKTVNKSFDEQMMYGFSLKQQSRSVVSKHQKPESGRILHQHNRRRRKSAERENTHHLSISSESRAEQLSYVQSLKEKNINSENSENRHRNSMYETRSRDVYGSERQRDFISPNIKISSDSVTSHGIRHPFQPLENAPRFSNMNITR